MRFYCGLTKKRMAQYDLHAVNIKENPTKTPRANYNSSWTINQITRQKSEQKGIESDDDEEDDDNGMIQNRIYV